MNAKASGAVNSAADKQVHDYGPGRFFGLCVFGGTAGAVVKVRDGGASGRIIGGASTSAANEVKNVVLEDGVSFGTDLHITVENQDIAECILYFE